MVGYQGTLRFDASKPDGTPRKLLDVTRLQDLGWEPRVSLQEGLATTYRWLLDNHAELRGVPTVAEPVRDLKLRPHFGLDTAVECPRPRRLNVRKVFAIEYGLCCANSNAMDMQYMSHPIDDSPQDHAVLRAVFETVHQPVFVMNSRDQRILNANPAACQTLGIGRAELIGRSWVNTAARLSGTTLRNVEISGNCFVVIAAESIFGRVERQDAPRDVLTGLPTRQALHDRISWDSQPEPTFRMAILFIDLDNFKQVNDTWGHVMGDRVLQVVAQRLASCIRPNDLLVRFGGDEFIVLVENVRRRRHLERLARRIRHSVRAPR